MKICYLSSTLLGKEMFTLLQQLTSSVSYYNLENERVSDFGQIDYDLGISFLYTYKIPQSEFLKNKVWLNFHPAPLPEYRGRNVCYHALMEEASHFGATLHYMDQNFDTGKIIKVRRFPIEPSHTAGDLSALSKAALADLFKEFVPSFLKGEIISGLEQENHGRYYKQQAIDEEIHLSSAQQLKIRALTVSPRFYAHSFINGKKYFFIPEVDLKK